MLKVQLYSLCGVVQEWPLSTGLCVGLWEALCRHLPVSPSGGGVFGHACLQRVWRKVFVEGSRQKESVTRCFNSLFIALYLMDYYCV